MSIIAASYALNHDKAFAGMVADGQLANIISKLNTGSTNIAYGKAVFRDGEDGAKGADPANVAADFVGVAVRELNRSYQAGDTFGAVAKKDFSVLTAGPIWVKAAEAVVAGDPVFARVGATNQGDFGKAVGAAGTLGVALDAKFVTGGASGALVKISFVVGG